jgi:hypothetical protein
MKQKTLLYLALITGLLFNLWPAGAVPVQAQEDLNTLLARAAARSFLITLTRPELAAVLNFYRLDTVTDDVVAELQSPPVTGFEIIEADWVSDVTYQVKAMLQPDNREIAVYTGRYDGRWRVESIDLPLATAGTPATNVAQTGSAAAPAGGVTPVSNNGAGQLVFQTVSGGDIYLIKADGTGLGRITNGLDPQLSPDGSQIAFTRWEPRYELFTIKVDGSNEQAWTHGWRKMKSPTWSADGATLTFSWQNGGRLDEEEIRKNLAQAAQDDDTISIPSNARKIEVENGILEYTIPADAFWTLKQLNLTTAEFTDLLTERHSYGPSGHPSQAGLVIYRGNRGIALNNVSAQIDQPITTDFRDHTPVISPDGQRIAVSYWQDGHWEVHTMNIDGSDRRRLTTMPLPALADKIELVSEEVYGKQRFVPQANPWWNNAAPTWSPDGSQIAFVTDRQGQWEIWIMNADGSDQRPMFSNGALDGLTLTYNGVDERMLSWR